MTTAKIQKINNFIEFQDRVFPDGNIPTREEIKQLVLSGDTSIRTHVLNKMYRDGVPTDPFLLTDEKTKDFANKFNETFGSTKQTSKNITGVVADVNKIFNKGLTLEDDFESVYDKKVFSSPDVKALKNAYTNTVTTKEIPTPSIKGSRKLASGKVPAGLLKTILEAVGSIPDEALRDATIASLIGYRGTDLTGVVSSAEQAAEEFPVRPYYDSETKSLITPDVDIGAGRKGKDPLKQLGPLMQSIFDRRFANAVDGELFPDIGTKDISNALNTHVFPKIPKEVTAHLKTEPKGYGAMRKVLASAIANDLGKPDIASELMGHGSKQLAGNTVLNKFYATIVDEGGLQARADTLLQFEKFMANALGVNTSRELATKLNLTFDSPELDMVYPEFDMDQPAQGPEGQKIQLSEEELELQKQQRLQAGEKSLAVDADITAEKQASAAKKIIESEADLKKAAEIKSQVSALKGDTQKQKKLKEKEDAQKLKNKNAADILQEMANEYGPVDQTKPVGKLKNKLLTAAGAIVTGAKDVLGAVGDVATSVAVPVGKALGSLGPAGGVATPALEAIGIGATAYDINRLRKMPSEQFVPEQVRSFLDEPEFVKEGQRAKAKRIALESTGLAPGGFDPSLGQAGRMAFPTREEQMAKDLILKKKEEQRQKIQSSLGESFRVGSNSFLNTN